ncbi:hypothetical protein FISHEDRAFT_53485, partial [Fistulina hepatica ATCC 64428]
DGCLRVYDALTGKVIKAIRNLDGEVASISVACKDGAEDVWIGHGSMVSRFALHKHADKMILRSVDAFVCLCLAQVGVEDEVNQISLNVNSTQLAFCMDSGTVGIVDLSNMQITRMKTGHESICDSVSFIPDRPRELVSGGYDHSLLHYDFWLGTILSKRKLPPLVSESGTALTLSPAFVLSISISSTGLLAAGTADGRLLVGTGGEKGASSNKRKRSRKWEGLDECSEVVSKIAEGPIVGVSFINPDVLVVSTLLATVMQFRLVRGDDGSILLEKLWATTMTAVKKVNTFTVDDTHLVVGGLGGDGRGVVEIWKCRQV